MQLAPWQSTGKGLNRDCRRLDQCLILEKVGE